MTKKKYSSAEIADLHKKFMKKFKNNDELGDVEKGDIKELLKAGYSPKNILAGKISLDDLLPKW